MAVEALRPFLQGTSGRKTRGLLRLIILCTIAGAAVASRLFSVIRKLFQPPLASAFPIGWTTAKVTIGFESIIHECQYPTFR